ncbi:hypothetical protein Acr_15g0000540 [Actinidia rufa]|uniref:Uncharacterized protein n=1 Tax=Actinidia rufa TaxID=165716 RepID=A0A7J0FRZ2_9ERIC|nr:hypothetical protein Acr_15g0000540 [Actinidia rufa]
MSPPQDSSWTMRRLFKLRQLGQPLIRHLVGNGRDTFLWLDNWHPVGPLYKKFGDRVVGNAGRSLLANVSDIICNGNWKWPNLQPNGAVEDSVLWTPATSGVSYVKIAWKAIRVSRVLRNRMSSLEIGGEQSAELASLP